MDLFFRIFRHLLPSGQAWRLAFGTLIARFFEGLAWLPAAARDFVDEVFDDLFPDRTRSLAQWEDQFGIVPATQESARRAAIDAAWKATGGQSPAYLQSVLRAAGFDVYVHEAWDGSAWRDPRAYTQRPLIGTVQCGEPRAVCGDPWARCNGFVANSPDYAVNLNLTRNPPPMIPSDPAFWPYFIYLGGRVFGERAVVSADRRHEFARLAAQIRPLHQWLVLMVDYVTGAVVVDEDGLVVVDNSGAEVVV